MLLSIFHACSLNVTGGPYMEVTKAIYILSIVGEYCISTSLVSIVALSTLRYSFQMGKKIQYTEMLDEMLCIH